MNDASTGYGHVLVATDFSESSEQAVQRAADVAQRFGSDLTLLHVIDYFPEDTPLEMVAPEDQDPETFLLEHARMRLADMSTRLGIGHAKLSVMVTTQSARRVIPGIATEKGADLIVVGRHGRRGFAEHLGSSAHAVLQHASCDVLVVD